jgi:hypothetical protein
VKGVSANRDSWLSSWRIMLVDTLCQIVLD